MTAKTQIPNEKSGLIGNFLLRANGIVPSIINNLKSASYERFKNKMFGIWNIFLSLASAFIVTRFAWQWMKESSAAQVSETFSLIVLFSVGISWFTGYLLMTVIVQLGLRKEKGKSVLNFSKALPRICFAILMSLLVTDPFILQSFESDIKNEIKVIADAAYKKKAEEVAEEQKTLFKPESDLLLAQKKTLENRLNENAKLNEERLTNLSQKTTGRITQRQVARLDRQYRSLDDTYKKQQNDTNEQLGKIAQSLQQIEEKIKTESETEATKAKSEVLTNTSYFAQHNALFHFAAREPYAGFKILATLLFVLFLELMTVLFKVFAKYSAYEAELDRLQALDEEEAAKQEAESARAVAEAVYEQKLSEKISENVDAMAQQQQRAESDLLNAQIEFRKEVQEKIFNSIKTGSGLDSSEMSSLKDAIWKNAAEQIQIASQQSVLKEPRSNSDSAPKNSGADYENRTTITVEYILTGKKCGIVFFGPAEKITGRDISGKLLAQYFDLSDKDNLNYPFEHYVFFNEHNKAIDIERPLMMQLGSENRLLMRPKARSGASQTVDSSIS